MPTACPHLHVVPGREATCQGSREGTDSSTAIRHRDTCTHLELLVPKEAFWYWYPKRHFGTSYIPGPMMMASPCFWYHILPRDNTGSVPAPNVLGLPLQSAPSHPATVTQPQPRAAGAGGGMRSVQAGDRFRWTGWEPCRAVSPCQLGNSSRTELMPPATTQRHLTPGSLV